jgi:hypothetical protein
VAGQQGHGLGGRCGTSLGWWLSLLGHCVWMVVIWGGAKTRRDRRT